LRKTVIKRGFYAALPNIPVQKLLTFPKFLNFGKVGNTQRKKLPVSEKLFPYTGWEISFIACLAQGILLVKEYFWATYLFRIM